MSIQPCSEPEIPFYEKFAPWQSGSPKRRILTLDTTNMNYPNYDRPMLIPLKNPAFRRGYWSSRKAELGVPEGVSRSDK
jgi:hypothetical protein